MDVPSTNYLLGAFITPLCTAHTIHSVSAVITICNDFYFVNKQQFLIVSSMYIAQLHRF